MKQSMHRNGRNVRGSAREQKCVRGERLFAVWIDVRTEYKAAFNLRSSPYVSLVAWPRLERTGMYTYDPRRKIGSAASCPTISSNHVYSSCNVAVWHTTASRLPRGLNSAARPSGRRHCDRTRPTNEPSTEIILRYVRIPAISRKLLLRDLEDATSRFRR